MLPVTTFFFVQSGNLGRIGRLVQKRVEVVPVNEHEDVVLEMRHFALMRIMGHPLNPWNATHRRASLVTFLLQKNGQVAIYDFFFPVSLG